MFRALWALPRVVLSLVWSLFFPKQPRTAPPPPAPVPDPDAPSEESQRVGHEVTDATGRTMALYALGLFGLIFVTMAALGWMYTRLYTPGEAMPVTPLQESFKHGSRAKTSITKDWEKINEQTRAHLTGYGWTDRAQGITRIPIARAMELVGKEGLPARSGETPYFPPPDQEKLPLMELETNVNANTYDPSE